MGVSKNRGTPNGWFIMVPNPMNKWMIWRFSHDFWFNTHIQTLSSVVVSNIFIFAPKSGEDFPFDEHIFSDWWFNHHLVYIYIYIHTYLYIYIFITLV